MPDDKKKQNPHFCGIGNIKKNAKNLKIALWISNSLLKRGQISLFRAKIFNLDWFYEWFKIAGEPGFSSIQRNKKPFKIWKSES